MSQLSSLCVYCGSSGKGPQSHRDAAVELGELMAARGIDLVYGGGRVGVMGTLADAVMSAGGAVTGVIPDFLMRHEVGHTGLTSLEIVTTMHERKARMAELSDAFLVLPGGIGTLEEYFEIVTWRHLKLHDKPIGILNTGGYWNRLIGTLENVVENGYGRDKILGLTTIAESPAGALDALDAQAAGHGRLESDKL